MSLILHRIERCTLPAFSPPFFPFGLCQFAYFPIKWLTSFFQSVTLTCLYRVRSFASSTEVPLGPLLTYSLQGGILHLGSFAATHTKYGLQNSSWYQSRKQPSGGSHGGHNCVIKYLVLPFPTAPPNESAGLIRLVFT